MPSFPIVDTHVHLWNLERLRYPWLEAVPSLNRSHLIEDYHQACGSVAVAKIIFVQCECEPAQSQHEVDWVTELERVHSQIRGIVAAAPLETGNAAEPALARLAANPLVKGVRRLIQSEPDIDFCLRPDFVRGVSLLSRYNLGFDLCIHHPQLARATELVRRCPDVRFILDHIGKPDIKAGLLEPWRTQLRALAALPNVWCKVSGLVTEADHQKWTRADLQPYVDHVLACFGFDRVMFGSDWPVAAQAADYPCWVSTLDQALQGSSPDELRRLYVRNAEACYRI